MPRLPIDTERLLSAATRVVRRRVMGGATVIATVQETAEIIRLGLEEYLEVDDLAERYRKAEGHGSVSVVEGADKAGDGPAGRARMGGA